MTVGSTLAVDQYHCCQADLARDPPGQCTAGPEEALNHNRKKRQNHIRKKGQNTPAGRPLNVVLP